MAFDASPKGCTFCKGARYLGGAMSLGLGRCVCVTPENMRLLDEAIEASADAERWVGLCETLRLGDDAGLEDKVEAYVDAVDETFSTVTAGRLEQGQPEELKATVDRAMDDAYAGGTLVAEALADYLVSIGLPANPAGAVENQALQRLIDLVTN